jgi:CRP/FNR family cyclic AMP-dependent transcriptional regulator
MQEIKAVYSKDAESYALLLLNVARQLSRRLRVADGLIAEHAGTFTTDPRPRK